MGLQTEFKALPTEKDLSDIESRQPRFGRVDLTVQERDLICAALRAMIEENEILRYKLLKRGVFTADGAQACVS